MWKQVKDVSRDVQTGIRKKLFIMRVVKSRTVFLVRWFMPSVMCCNFLLGEGIRHQDLAIFEGLFQMNRSVCSSPFHFMLCYAINLCYRVPGIKELLVTTNRKK